VFAILCLGPLIRCQHLSFSWLSAVATVPEIQHSKEFVLTKQIRCVQQLLKVKAVSSDAVPTRNDWTNAWPDSWFLGPRLYIPLDRVQLTWQVDVSQLREAAISCAESNSMQHIKSQASVPVRGFPFSVWIYVDGRVSEERPANSVLLGMFIEPANAKCSLFEHTQPMYSCQ
jgi:hypothetical protein